MTHIMLDLETMDSGPNAAIVSIGAVTFDPHSYWISEDTFYTDVDLADSMREGGTVSASTIKFWLTQAKAAQPSWTASQTSLTWALADLVTWTAGVNPKHETLRLWGHGATFDPVVLNSAFNACYIISPFDYRSARDTRTVFEMAGLDFTKFPKTGTAHNALHDAITQTRAVQAAFATLFQKG